MIFYRPGVDLISIKIEDVTFWITPLTQEQKIKVIDSAINDDGEKMVNVATQGAMAMSYCIKELEGLQTPDGKEYKLAFEKNGRLTDQCVNDLLSIKFCESALIACYQMMVSPNSIKVDGVTVDLKNTKTIKKKLKTTRT